MVVAKIMVDSVSKRFGAGGTAALADCTMQVLADELLCVIGPSGCGKTTLLRIIDGLLRPDAGRVLIDGAKVTAPRRDVAVVFQHFGLFPWKTAHENVAYGLRLQGRSRAEVDEIVPGYIDLVGLRGFESNYPYQLSGGMQQRVGLARALAVDPAVLLMDEPFGSLDAQTRELMQEELLRIWRVQRKTLVFVTHSIDEAIVLGDRIAIMGSRPGRVQEVVDVGLPRPREPEVVRGSARYAELRHHIWNQLRPQAGGSFS